MASSSSPRGAFSRKERMLWGRRSWPEILKITNTCPSLHRHPLPKLFTERHNINPYSNFLPEKSILQDTQNPAPRSQVLLQMLYYEHCCLNGPWPPLLSLTPAYSPQAPCSSPLRQVLPSLTPSQTQEEFTSLTLSPTALYLYFKKVLASKQSNSQGLFFK